MFDMKLMLRSLKQIPLHYNGMAASRWIEIPTLRTAGVGRVGGLCGKTMCGDAEATRPWTKFAVG